MPRFRKRTTMGKAHEKHSGTIIHVMGPASTIVSEKHILRDTEVGARDPDGGNDTIQLGRSYGNECNQGDTWKYVNITLACGPRQYNAGQNAGWIEWAFVIKKNSDPEPTSVNIGTQTLGDVCTKYFRNECIYTGSVPVGGVQPTVQPITLKIPKSRQTLKSGDEWTLYLYARTISSTETATDTFKVLSSFNYIHYH